MGLLSKLFGGRAKSAPRLAETMKLEMAVEVMMVTWLFRVLTESGTPKPEATKILEDMARAEVFQKIQRNALAQAAVKVGVPWQILEKYHLVEALIAYYEGNGNKAAAILVQNHERPELKKMIEKDMTTTGKTSLPEYMSALERGSTEAYSLGNAALVEWTKTNLLR